MRQGLNTFMPDKCRGGSKVCCFAFKRIFLKIARRLGQNKRFTLKYFLVLVF